MYVKDVMLYTAEDLREFMFLAMQSPEDIGVHTKEGKIADAKSVLGLMALDYNKPVKVVTEDGHFIKQIGKWLVSEPKD
ncbi:MAG TPA: HPr family phosphocarrier protein [Candidatus Anaerotruncus excrementipullorum]|uniref:HPr family phosphocarrier protein n=1 Tax=Candidatus Anaerotruncus excrementipullorum TaxID=2838465 RepID=A0A9D1WPT2_9FIRM|nr:HPr family phosphocarrier protein [Candidatus Anaerotruncus excrementipullorum]